MALEDRVSIQIQSKRQAFLLSLIKGLTSISSSFLPVFAIYLIFRAPLSLLIWPSGLGELAEFTLWLLLLPWGMKFLASDSRDSRLLSASMKTMGCRLGIRVKVGKMSTLSQSLTLTK